MLRDWRDRGLFLLVLLEAAERRLLLKAEAFIKDVSEDVLTLSLEQLAELTLTFEMSLIPPLIQTTGLAT